MTESTVYPLAQFEWGHREIQAILDRLQKKQITAGKSVEEFEKSFAQYVGRRHAIMVNSGSSANLIATASLFYKSENPLRPGDEVIVPALGWATTYSPLHQLGLKMKFIDINLKTLNIDTKELNAAVNDKTKLVLPINILGNPCQWRDIFRIQKNNSFYILEDNCESLGAIYDNKYCGTFGSLSTHSLFFAHHLTTGEGGMITTDSDELNDICRILRSHGWSRSLSPSSPWWIEEEEFLDSPYHFILPGYNVRPTELAAAAGLEQIKKIDSSLAMRRKNAEYFHSLFNELPEFIIQEEVGLSSWYGFTIILTPELQKERKSVLEKLKTAGIEFRPITGGSLLNHPVAKYYDYSVYENIRSATIAHKRGFFVGNYNKDLRPQLDHLYTTLKEVL